MKILKAPQIRELDRLTIENEPISSIDLMERASEVLFEAFIEKYEADKEVYVFVGHGNNGGDALALARLLSRFNSLFVIRVFVVKTTRRSDDCVMNLDRLSSIPSVEISILTSVKDFPVLPAHVIIVDGLFGTGLSKPLTGIYAELVDHINSSEADIFSIDMPSGLFSEDNTNNDGAVINNASVITFQVPKLSFLLADSKGWIKDWEVWDIGLDAISLNEMDSAYSIISDEEALSLFKDRDQFSHKGTFGKALLVAGQKGMMGAAMLASKACLRSGVGLLTTHVPSGCSDLIQNYVPEALVSIDRSELMFTEDMDIENCQAVGVGPGIGTKPNTLKAFAKLILQCDKPLVIDADGINLLSQKLELLESLPFDTILTPHPKEFDRLTHPHRSAYDRLQSQIKLSVSNNLIVVLKGAHTSVSFPDGSCSFNNTGNHGMATAGSGDVLTGIILGLLAQGYAPNEAALLGVWWHGKAGDLFAESNLAQSMIASDIIEHLKGV